ncbi:hypothetical protein IMY05_009G0092400 [Salix suchowensis]|nr:hypothetical protein IMY05_009G0092400 [Salix suchowensis]
MQDTAKLGKNTLLKYLADDVQVQLYMMSPCVLKTLSADTKILHLHHSPLAQQVAEITFDVEETDCGPSVTAIPPPPKIKKKLRERKGGGREIEKN